MLFPNYPMKASCAQSSVPESVSGQPNLSQGPAWLCFTEGQVGLLQISRRLSFNGLFDVFTDELERQSPTISSGFALDALGALPPQKH